MMKMMTTTMILIGALGAVSVHAQTDSVAEHLARSYELRSGFDDPASVPRVSAVAQLRHVIHELGLERDDIATLERWAHSLVDLEQQHNERIESHHVDFCDQLQSGVSDVVSLVNETSRIVEKHREAVLMSFEETTADLSSPGRLVVNDYIDNVLVPGTVILHLDYEKLFREAGPEAVAEHMKATCSFVAAHSEQEIIELLNRAPPAPERPNSFEEHSEDMGSEGIEQQGQGAELRSM